MKKTLLLVLLFNLFLQFKGTTQVLVAATAGTTSGGYPTLGIAFSAINNGTHQGIISITLIGNIAETSTASLDSSGNPTGSSYTSISIQPATNTPAAISGSVAGPLINLNGADNITIDGVALSGSGATLTINNTSTAAAASTIRFINDATSNSIKNCNLKGAGVALTTGVVLFSTGLLTGNDNNTLLNNDIDCTASAIIGIYSAGSSTTIAIENSGNVVNNCWIHDFFNSTQLNFIGVYLPGGTTGGNTDWTFTGNSFYQSTARVVTSNSNFYGILTGPTFTSDKHVLTGNFFGGSAPGASNTTGNMQLTGTGASAGFIGFYIQTGGPGSLIDGNIVRNITLTSASASSGSNSGIYAYVGGFNGTITITNNQVKDINLVNNTSAGFIQFQGIYANGRVTTAGTTVTPAFTVQNNVVSNIIATSSVNAEFQFHGIRLETSSGGSLTSASIANVTFNASGNQVNSFTITTTGTSTFLRGIGVVTTAGTASAPLQPKATLTNNTIRDLVVGSNLASYATPTVSGIQVTGAVALANADVQTITGNTIYNLSATTTADVSNSVAGIIVNNSTYIIEKNKIYSLSNSSLGTTTTPIVSGILIRSVVATSTVKNNFVSVGAGATTNTNFFGILNNTNSTAPINIYYNTVYITGTGGTKNSVGFYRGNEAMTAAITSTVDIKDNIFYNFRSGGTGSNYAIGSFGTGTWTSDYNILKSTNPATVASWNNIAMDLPTYQTASGQDANSKNITVTFVDPANGDLHLSGSSNGDLNLRGTPIAGITTDFDGQTRSTWAPYMGADEASVVLPLQLLAFAGYKEGKINKLEWSTSSELNSKGFELLRSADGRNFSSIATILTKAEGGNSNTSLTYSFTDEKALTGNSYYQLKQVDKTGNVTYSPVVMIRGDRSSWDISAVYPNPTKQNINLIVSSPGNENISVTLFDLSGRMIKQFRRSLVAGDNSITIDVTSLSTGIYHIKMMNDKYEVKTTQFIKQ